MSLEDVTYKMPCNKYINRRLYAESKVELKGLIPEQSKGFYIQFVDAQHNRANKALSFKADFQESLPFIELGCFKNGEWIKKKKLHGPLKPGGRFLIQFIVTNNSYKVIANGQFLVEFPQFLQPKDVFFFEMDGEVILEDLIIPPWLPTGR